MADMLHDFLDWYDSEPRPSDYFYIEEELIPEPMPNSEKRRLYCYSRYDIINKGKKIIELDPIAAVISISSTDDPGPELNELGIIEREGYNQSVLKLQFDDIGPEGNGAYGCYPQCITNEQVHDLLEYIEKEEAEGKNFYIHCDAGQSRSQAVVRFILDIYGGEDVWEIRRANPPLTPNIYVLSRLKREIWKRTFAKNC